MASLIIIVFVTVTLIVPVPFALIATLTKAFIVSLYSPTIIALNITEGGLFCRVHRAWCSQPFAPKPALIFYHSPYIAAL